MIVDSKKIIPYASFIFEREIKYLLSLLSLSLSVSLFMSLWLWLSLAFLGSESFSLRETPLGPGAKKEGCFRRL